MMILMRALFTAAGAFFGVAVALLIMAVWTGDGRFGWTALLVAVLAVVAVFAGAGVASTIDRQGAHLDDDRLEIRREGR